MKMAAVYIGLLLALVAGALLVFAGPILAVAAGARIDRAASGAADRRAANAGQSGGAGELESARQTNRIATRSRADGGNEVSAIGDDLGVPRNAQVADAGEIPRAASESTANAQALLQRQVDALRARTQELEQERLARDEKNNTLLLSEIDEELRDLNAQYADAQSRSEAERTRSAGRAEESQRAIDSLGATLTQLADGDDDVGDALAAAAEALPAQSQRDLVAAQSAIATHNLGEARAFVQAAIHDASSSSGQ